VAAQTVAGSLNGELFGIRVKECLVPALGEDDIVIMDNLSTRKAEGIEESIKKANSRVFSPYSSDLNPIEEMRSKRKAYLRQ
jgi:transposase